ncbi:RagB/SusD family nutrient uptake outer membrane protein [Lutibacter sp. B1]|uniref:RagB/SusD family nutrient uptake outer membrane protein n=1 Tax=Lutibacter sp. B1 TaxID=2725996 RepID=UPI0014575A2E|nr:RagB/SusD family nutrient uptake outer membrane protein [Lutibacter sp. B1]NLP57731.1 RagB/SusD family nutrient uptake outer membrane protein [Lutibacter sp. B1]
MKKIIFTVITSLLIFTSCSDDFVENPPTGTLDTEYVFSTEENVEKAVLGLYDLMQYNYAKDWHSAYFVKLLPGDDANAAGGNAGDQAQLQDIDDYANVSISNTSITSNWDLFYRVIALANVIVDNVEGSSLSNKAKVLAEAKFMRAWCYFELTTMWGDVPLRLHNPDVVSPEAFALAKSPRTEIYTQVESDLTEAITGLPDKSAVSENFRVCKGTAQALMGKVLVFQEKYSQAIPYLAAVIANPAHDLEPDPANVWTIGSEFGIESLFELGYISTEGYDWGSFKWGGRVESNAHIILMGTRDFFDVAPVGLLNGWGFNLPTKKLIDAFDAMGDTERKAATLMTEAELIAGGGAVKEPAENIWDYEGAIRIKYTTRASDTSPEGTVRELNYTTNWRLLRYAEVLLLAAEAYNKDGQDGQALIELNKVHERAGLAPLSGLTGDALFNAIVNEKFLELAHEGQRFWDLVRWGRAATELAGTGYASKNDLFPIPVTEIELNDALTNADQNPGY